MFYLKKRLVLWVSSLLLIADIAYIAYNLQNELGTNGLLLAILFLGLLMGIIITYILNSDKREITPTIVRESSHTVLESMKKVFKIVTAEGIFNEIYDYQETKKLFSLFPSTKKALVIVKGKVQMGYDFAKCEWEVDEVTKKIKLMKFPEPEILSLETDFEYYNIEEKFYDLFSKEDLSKIQSEGKKQMMLAAKKSHLPETAAEQIELVIKELLLAKDWNLENSHLIRESIQRLKFD